jgi:hypothetical protein
MLYLIIRCDELNDQWECDADRTPVCLTENWKKWFNINNPDYLFEVYEYDNNEFNLIKEYNEAMEEGMAFYYWDENNDKACVIEKWPNKNRDDAIPKSVLRFKKFFENNYKLELYGGGSFSYNKDGKTYIYGEYYDSKYSTPW